MKLLGISAHYHDSAAALIRDGETGRLFEAGDAEALAKGALDLLADCDRWPELKAAGRRFVETERNWAVSVARYMRVYEALLDKR